MFNFIGENLSQEQRLRLFDKEKGHDNLEKILFKHVTPEGKERVVYVDGTHSGFEDGLLINRHRQILHTEVGCVVAEAAKKTRVDESPERELKDSSIHSIGTYGPVEIKQSFGEHDYRITVKNGDTVIAQSARRWGIAENEKMKKDGKNWKQDDRNSIAFDIIQQLVGHNKIPQEGTFVSTKW